MTVMVSNALVSSSLDYCNSLFRSLSFKNITRLQNFQNSLAHIVSGASRFSDITPALKSLHWLPVKQCIIFKTLVLIHKYLTIGKPNTLLLIRLYIHLLLKQDVVIQKRCFSKFPSTSLQFINLIFISISVSYMLLLNFGMICHWKFKLLLHYHVPKDDLKLFCFRNLFLPRFSYY